MTKETISTFLPIVNIGIRAKSVKSKAANLEIKLLKTSVVFLQPIRYHVIDSLQSCMSITWDVWPLVPLLVRCVVCLQFTPTVWLSHFSKIRFFIRFWTMEKKKSENEEKSSSTVGLFVILDNVSSSRSWSPENWRLVYTQSEQVSTNVSFF